MTAAASTANDTAARNRRAIMLSFMVSFGGFVFGLDAALISGTFRYLTPEFSLTPDQVGWIGGSAGFGVLPALLLTGFIVDRLGRKGTLLIIGALYLISAVGSALAQSYEQLVIARFLGGMAFASLSVSSMYLGEVAPPDKRGMMVAINQLNIVIGLLAAFLANYFIQAWSEQPGWPQAIGMGAYTWQWMFAVEIPAVILWIAFLLRIPESPRWLVLRGRNKEAAGVLSRLLPEHEVPPAIRDIERTISEETSGKGQQGTFEQLRLMFSPAIRLATLVGVVIVIVQPSTGINAINTYAPMVFAQAGVGVDASFSSTIWLGVVSVIGTGAAILLIDSIGRRTILLFGLTGAALGLGACAIGFANARYEVQASAIANLPADVDRMAVTSLAGQQFDSDVALKKALADKLGGEVYAANETELLQASIDLNVGLVFGGILLFIFAFQFSIGPVMWVVLSELFPTAVRGVAIPACGVVLSGVNFVIQTAFPWQLANWGAMTIFAFYVVACLTGLVFLAWLLPETRGKTIEEIASALKPSEKLA